MIVNTASVFPEGEYIMTCSQVPAEVNRRGTLFWQFEFKTELEGEPATYSESCPIWLCGPLFKALGFKEVAPGSYDVIPPGALNKKIKGKIIHEKVKDQVYARFRDLTPMGSLPLTEDGIPF